MLTGGVNRGLPSIILFRFTNGEGNVISDFDVITQRIVIPLVNYQAKRYP